MRMIHRPHFQPVFQDEREAGYLYAPRGTMAKDVVIAAIRKAFAETSAPNPADIAHCDQCALFVERFLETCPKDWAELQSADIAYEYAALTAVTPSAWRFLLPAYVIWHLENYERSNSKTVDHLIYQLTRSENTDHYIIQCYESLSLVQVQAIEAFLIHIASQTHNPILAQDARTALSSYWSVRATQGV